MPLPKISTTFIVTVEHEKPIADLIDLVADRAYRIQGVTDVTATLLSGVNILTASHERDSQELVRTAARLAMQTAEA